MIAKVRTLLVREQAPSGSYGTTPYNPLHFENLKGPNLFMTYKSHTKPIRTYTFVNRNENNFCQTRCDQYIKKNKTSKMKKSTTKN